MIVEELGRIEKMFAAINERLDMIEDELKRIDLPRKSSGRPKNIPKKRGPQNTRMMKVERAAVVAYLEVEQHRFPESCTPQDAFVVWNRPENKALYDKASIREDSSRGYKDYNALSTAVVYYAEKDFLRSHRRNHTK